MYSNGSITQHASLIDVPQKPDVSQQYWHQKKGTKKGLHAHTGTQRQLGGINIRG